MDLEYANTGFRDSSQPFPANPFSPAPPPEARPPPSSSSTGTPVEVPPHPPLPARPGRALTDVLRTKRKARLQRVCAPCRVRKVKCSYDTPCRSCAERGHPELCDYSALEARGAKRRWTEGTAEGATADDGDTPGAWDEHYGSPKGNEWRDLRDKVGGIERLLRELGEELRQLRSDVNRIKLSPNESCTHEDDSQSASDRHDENIVRAMPAGDDPNDDPVYIGGNSVPALVAALAKNNEMGVAVQELTGKDALPVFGLDNESTTYPFVDLWGIPHGSFRRIELLCELLPNTDTEYIQFFTLYRDNACVLFPGIVDIVQFEAELLSFLRCRNTETLTVQSGPLSKQIVYGKSLHWLGLLFAAFASGIQCSNLPRKDRQVRSQIYVCCAYECLRIVNYFSKANMLDLQNLLVLGNVLSNSVNAGVAWSLLGLTIRLAQSLGLHYETASSDPSAPQTLKSNIWWQIIWQDSVISITFDRTSPSTIVASAQPRHKTSNAKLTYVESMRHICKIGLDIVNQRAVARSPHHRLLYIVERRDKMLEIVQQVDDHLTDISKCRLMREQLEFWNFNLHRSYILSELCRPTLRNEYSHADHRDLARTLKAFCIENLANTVEAFLGLHNVTYFATQSWAAMYRSLSSGLLLGFLGESQRSERAKGLLFRLAGVMSTLLSQADLGDLSAPLTRSVTALNKLIQPRVEQTEDVGRDAPAFDVQYGADPAMGMQYSGPLGASPYAQVAYGDENSPYSLINSIIWGQSESPPDAAPFPTQLPI